MFKCKKRKKNEKQEEESVFLKMVEKKRRFIVYVFHILLISSDEFFCYTFTEKKESYDNKKELSKHKMKLFAAYPYSQFYLIALGPTPIEATTTATATKTSLKQ